MVGKGGGGENCPVFYAAASFGILKVHTRGYMSMIYLRMPVASACDNFWRFDPRMGLAEVWSWAGIDVMRAKHETPCGSASVLAPYLPQAMSNARPAASK